MNNTNLICSDGGGEINPKKIICNTRHHHFDKSFSKAHNMKQIEISVTCPKKIRAAFCQSLVRCTYHHLHHHHLSLHQHDHIESIIVSPSKLYVPRLLGNKLIPNFSFKSKENQVFPLFFIHS